MDDDGDKMMERAWNRGCALFEMLRTEENLPAGEVAATLAAGMVKLASVVEDPFSIAETMHEVVNAIKEAGNLSTAMRADIERLLS